MMKAIGVFGGTFDPVHQAHIAMAQQARQLLDLDHVRLIPCHQPPHRQQPQLNSHQRLTLLTLALAEEEGLVVDDCELQRERPSWTVETLEVLREIWGSDTSLVLLMGADAFIGLKQWYRWQDIPSLAHIAIFKRPGYSLDADEPLSSWLEQSTIDMIHQQPAGAVVSLPNECQPWSATDIRAQLAAGNMPASLSPSVKHYIEQHQLYGYFGDPHS